RAGRRSGPKHLCSGTIRAAEFTHFSDPHRVIQRVHCVRNGRARIRKMNLVKVDGLDLKAPQTGVERLTHVFRARAALAFAHFHPELRGNDYLTAAALERFAEKVFALPRPVNVRRIKKIDTRVECGIDHRRRSRSIRPPTEVVASDAN